jgi:hypothetical protein
LDDLQSQSNGSLCQPNSESIGESSLIGSVVVAKDRKSDESSQDLRTRRVVVESKEGKTFTIKASGPRQRGAGADRLHCVV